MLLLAMAKLGLMLSACGRRWSAQSTTHARVKKKNKCKGVCLVIKGDGSLKLAHILINHTHVAIGFHVEFVVLNGRVVVLQCLESQGHASGKQSANAT